MNNNHFNHFGWPLPTEPTNEDTIFRPEDDPKDFKPCPKKGADKEKEQTN
ncbi:MAG: hypothetical protein J6K42_04825 [Clostridia bacterium]|nr:hypothetical protein [Clostridia bacterium]